MWTVSLAIELPPFASGRCVDRVVATPYLGQGSRAPGEIDTDRCDLTERERRRRRTRCRPVFSGADLAGAEP
jgi:hypothetical protein